MLKFVFLVSVVLLATGASSDPDRSACLKAMGAMTVKGAHDQSTASLIGKEGQEITKVDGYAIVRLVKPLGAMTMDFRRDRLNLYVDCDGKIVATTAG